MVPLTGTVARYVRAARKRRAVEKREGGLSRFLPALQALMFPEQKAFVNDPNALVVAQCTRRAAKSFGGGIKLISTCCEYAKAQALWLSITREEGRRVAWGPIFREIIEDRIPDLAKEVVFKESTLSIEFSNGSVIYLVGADANEKEKRKIKGQKYRAVYIDEPQDMINGLEDLIHDVVAPAVAEYSGQILLGGTPGEIAQGFFYDISTGQSDESAAWSRHHWSWENNPAVKDEIAKYVSNQAAKIPGFLESPVFLRNYRGLWIADPENLVYRLDIKKHLVERLPVYTAGKWHYVLGCDLGYNDPVAFVVMTYHDHDPKCYIVEVSTHPGWDITDTANGIKALDAKYHFERQIVDGANKQAVAEIRKRHQLPVQAAEKTGKAEFIDILNAALTKGELVLLRQKTEPLQREMLSLTWDKKALVRLRRVENPRQANHACDASLYGYRPCYAYLSTRAPPPPPKDSAEAYERARQEEEDRWEAAAEAAEEEERLMAEAW